jgi:hypothetical protein
MSIKSKTIKVRCCDFCGETEESKDEVIQACSNCRKDFCTKCGELFSTEYGDVEVEGYEGELLLCKDCLTAIFSKKKPEGKCSLEAKK